MNMINHNSAKLKMHDDTATSQVESRLEKEFAEYSKTQKDLLDRQEYLDRRVTSNSNNLRELTAGL